MDINSFKGRWHELKGNVKKQWGRLTDNEIDQMEGDAERMIGSLQKTYGYTRDEARRQVNDFLNRHQ